MSDHIDTIREALEIGEVAARTKHLPPLVFKRSLDALAALESALALDPLRQPVAGDAVEAGRMPNYSFYKTIYQEYKACA